MSIIILIVCLFLQLCLLFQHRSVHTVTGAEHRWLWC